LLIAKTGRGHVSESQYDVAVYERRSRSRLYLDSDGGTLRLLPKTRRGTCFEIDLIDARLLV
jgi:hypothetical protein